MTGTPNDMERRSRLAEGMAEWLELFDEEFARRDVAPAERPLEAVFALFRHGSIQIHAGDEQLDLSSPVDHAQSQWFRELYAAVLHWYEQRLGAGTLRRTGVRPLDGVVLIRGVAFGLSVPAHRSKVETEGETAWLYFDEDVGDGEDPKDWIVGGPDLATLGAEQRKKIVHEARSVASALRYIDYRRMAADKDLDQEAVKLVSATSTYLQQAARRVVSGKERERGPAWFDLQMAVESSMKAVLRHATGAQPHIHDLVALASRVRAQGAVIDDATLAGWPDFRSVSEWRYGQGEPWGLSRLHRAYLSSLAVARASLALFPIGLRPGFGLLMRYPPWLPRPGGQG